MSEARRLFGGRPTLRLEWGVAGSQMAGAAAAAVGMASSVGMTVTSSSSASFRRLRTEQVVLHKHHVAGFDRVGIQARARGL